MTNGLNYGCVCCVFKDDYFMKNELGLTERKDCDDNNPYSGRVVPPVAFDNPFYGHGWWPLCGTSSSEDDYAKPHNNVCSYLMHFMLNPCIVDPILFVLWIGTGFCCCRTLPCSSRVVSQHYVDNYPQYLTGGYAFEQRNRPVVVPTATKVVEEFEALAKI